MLRMDRLESMIDDHSKKLASLRNRVVVIKKASGDSMDTLALKANIDELKKFIYNPKS